MADSKTSEEEALQYAEGIINTVRESLIVLDHDLRVISANPSFYDTFQVKPEEVDGWLIYDLGNKQWDIPKLRQMLESLLPQKTVIEDYEIEHEFADIGSRAMLLNAREIQRKSGKERLILLAIEDITEHKRQENLLSESEERYRRLFETANDGILLLEKAEGKITHANPAIKKMLGYSPDELIGKGLVHIGFPKDIGTIQEISHTLEKDGILHYEDAPVQAKSGQVIDTDIYMVDKASLVQCNIRDITERKQAEEELKKIEWMLSSQQKTHLAAGRASEEPYVPPYGDLTKLNTSREILDAVGEETLKDIVGDFLDLLETSVAVYEANGDYALGIFSSSWCRLMDQASYQLCGTEDREQALRCGKWICHESCWNTAKQAIETGEPVDVECEGGIRLYAVPIRVHGEIIGTINVGYGDPPSNIYSLSELASKYGVNVKDLIECSNAYESRPPFIIELAKRRTHSAAHLIGEIVERQQAEQQLRESEEKYRMLVENLNEVIYTLDEKGRITYVSPPVESVGGYTPSELLGKQFIDFVHPDDKEGRVEQFRKIMAGSDEPSEYRFITKDNQVVWVTTTARPFLKEGQVAGLQGVLVDITERKKAEQEKDALEAQLRQSQKMEAIGTLAGGIAHDFNNILSSVIGYAELSLDEVEKGSVLHRNLSQVLTAGNRAKDLVKQILTLSRREEQEFKLTPVVPLVKEALKMLRSTFPSSIEIRENILTEQAVVHGDPTQLHQVFVNLATNAKQAMSNQGGVLEVSVEPVSFDESIRKKYTEIAPGNYLWIVVSDTGCGISEQYLDKIFEPFFTSSETGAGTGLGLSVVHGIVKSHSGHIKVYSEPGKGTIFHVYLPLAEQERSRDISTGQVGKELPTGTESILLVEDEKPIIDLQQQILETLGYHVTSRTSSVEALEAFRANPYKFDLLVTDITMPNMTGDRLALKVKEIRPDFPVILCTGFSEKINDQKSKDLGIESFLMKPVTKKDMAETARKVLDGNSLITLQRNLSFNP